MRSGAGTVRAERPRTRSYPVESGASDRPFRDVRLTPELAHRRLLVTMLRAITRIVVLVVLDAGVAWSAKAALGARFGATTLGVIAVTLLALAAFGSYRAGPPRRSFLRILGAVAVTGATLAVLSWIEVASAPVQALGMYLVTVLAAVAVTRGAVELSVRAAYRRGLLLRRALLVGTRRDTRTVRRLLLDGSRDQRVMGLVTPAHVAERGALGTMRDLPQLLREHDVEELVIVTRLADSLLDDATEEAFSAGARCFVVPWALNPPRARAEAVRLGACPAFRLHPRELELPEFLLKRTLDLVVTALLLVIAIPLGALIALAIRVETPGPVFYRHRRVGLGGREFTMWKFRSMRASADADVGTLGTANEYGDAPFFKVRRDPRVTRVGRFLRRSSLDELPQLINVLRGEMSLVGPRPPLPREVRRYAPHHQARLSVLPGMTGPWQVGGRNLITDFEEVVRMERDYIETWSLGADLRILVRTIGAVASGRGAY